MAPPKKPKIIPKQAREDRHETVAVKVSPASAALIEGICARTGLVKNSLMHMVLDVLIKYMDDRHNLTPEAQRLMLLFERLEGWGKTFNLCDPGSRPEITCAIYLIGDGRMGGKPGQRAMMLLRPFFGEQKETFNVRDITECFMRAVHPLLYRRLREMAEERDCADVAELLNLMLDEHEDDRMTEDIREMFEDCMRGENGRPVVYGERTRRIHRRTIDDMPTLFDWEGEQRQREEPPAGMEQALNGIDN